MGTPWTDYSLGVQANKYVARGVLEVGVIGVTDVHAVFDDRAQKLLN